MKRLRIAIQSKGRLSAASFAYLQNSGLNFEQNSRSLINPCTNADVDILLLRSVDIPEYVSRGVADFGIAGENVLLEKNIKVISKKRMDFGYCKLVIAIPTGSSIRTPDDFEGERIATSHPRLLNEFLSLKKINAVIIPMRGSVEIAPQLNLADAICDLVQTGKTLEANGLKPLVTLLESQAVLIQSPYCKQEDCPAYLD